MTTPASVAASTSSTNVSLRQQHQQPRQQQPQQQQQRHPIRIAQPPPPATTRLQSNYAAYGGSNQHRPQASSSSIGSNFTTTFHANPANGLTTTLGQEARFAMSSMSTGSLPHHPPKAPPHYQRPLLEQSAAYTATTSFPSTETTDASSTPANYFKPAPPGQSFTLPHFNSVPALGHKQQPQHHQPQQHPPLLLHQQRPSTSSLSEQQPPLSQSASNSLLRHQQRIQPQQNVKMMSQQSLFDVACAQQRQIDANTSELEERRRLITATIASATKRPLNGTDAPNASVLEQINALKTQIGRDEAELTQLGGVQRDARQLAAHNQQQRQELRVLEDAYAQDDAQMRMALGCVDVLKKQLDLLYQRRASAASAAIAQQRKVNAQMGRNFEDSQPNHAATANGAEQNSAQQPTPQPLFSQTQTLPHSQALLQQIAQSQKPIFNQQQQQQHQRPQASVVPFQMAHNTSCKIDFQKDAPARSHDECDGSAKNSNPQTRSDASEKARAPPPPPPFPHNYKHFSKDIPIQRCYDESQRFLARGKPDQVSLRADSLSAVKRRSWAQSSDDGQGGSVNGALGADNIWRYLVEEQRKGRTHVSFADIMAARRANAPPQSPLSPEKFANRSNASASITTSQGTLKPRSKPVVDVVPMSATGGASRDASSGKSLAAQTANATKPQSNAKDLAASQLSQKTRDVKAEANAKSNANANAAMQNEEEEFDENLRNESGSDDTSNTTTIEADDDNENEKASNENENRQQAQQYAREENNFTSTNGTNDIEEEEEDDEEEEETTVIAKATLATVREEEKNSPTKNVINDNDNNVSSIDIDSEKHESHDNKNNKNNSNLHANANNDNDYDNAYDNHNEDDNEDDDDDDDDEDDDDGFMEGTPQFVMAEESGSTTTDEASSTVSTGDEPMFDEQSLCTPTVLNGQRGVPKGILRAPVVTHHKRRVVFDMTVLFLDVATEGEFDMLVELASKIPDISVANGEGITALHNAICAGNHDIVKFLIENNADVNALDLDGWSPLHCAVSCNNLVMVRQLVEGGACVFTTTLSTAETAGDLFAESSNPDEPGAQYIQLVENSMGIVNHAKVYAAFAYDAEMEDELSFEEGDELRVVDRCDQINADASKSDGDSDSSMDEAHDESNGSESLWWLCERVSPSGEKRRGLVPRNYLALYPPLRYRVRRGFDLDTRLDLPAELAAPRTSAQRRRRRRQRRAAALHRDEENFALLQWRNVSAAAAAAAVAATLPPSEKVTATVTQQSSNGVLDANSITVNSDHKENLDTISAQQLSTYA